MKKLLGLTIIFSIASFCGLSAMEQYAHAEQVAPRYLVEQMEQENQAARLRQYNAMRRQQQVEERQRELQRRRENIQENRPVQRRLFGQDVD